MPASLKQAVSRVQKQRSHPLYAQVVVVALAFALMVILSYRFMSDIEHRHMLRDVNNAISNTQARITADLMEPETFLGSISETIRIMILQGESFDSVATYINGITKYISTGNRLMSYSAGVYGFFEVYDGGFCDGTGWIPPEKFDPEDRPWYKAAVETNGEVVVTDPYLSVALDVVVITFARRIFDDNGKPLGVVCLDMLLDRIKGYAVDTYVTDGGYGILLDKNFNVLAHPHPAYIGRALRDMNDGPAIEEELRQGKNISERKATDYKGGISILFIHRLDNGWYMAILTYAKQYFSTVRRIAQILIALGSYLTLIVSAILIRMIAAKYKSDEVTEAKTREADVSRRSANILENILNGIDAMIYVTVPKTGEILFMNHRMKKHYKIEGECVGQLCYKILQEGLNDRCDFCPCYQLDKEPDKAVVWIEHSSLTKRVYQNTDCYIEWPGGAMVHLQHSVDITELNEAKEQAIKANSAKSNFLARVSHEIRTPMNAILGITEIQLQNGDLPPDMEEALGKIYNSGYLLLNIINDILDLSKIEAGKLELVPVKYDVPSLINDTVSLNVMRFDSKPIEFTLDIDENIPTLLFGDELRIKQILNNLLSNAFKYTDSGEVSLSVVAENNTSQEEQVTLVFRVGDTGQGMTPDQVDKLFDEYTRFNNEANRTTEGTGLGMSITKHLVHMMNGEISVESELEKGSLFTVRLPQKKIDASVLGRAVVENLKQSRIGKMSHIKKAPQIVREYMPYGRILVVDDVETNLYVACGLLAPYGLSIDTAESGFEAIKKIKDGAAYDVIYMDHFMPRMDGIETTQKIRGMGYKHPIVALTANALTGQAEMFLEKGFDGYISKPIDIRQLNASLNKLVRNKYSSEVVQAAEKLKDDMENKQINTTPQSFLDPELANIFTRDAGKAIVKLEAIHEKRAAYGDDDIQNYIITVHSMKSALANIGEAELSGIALKLEMAGRGKDTAVMAAETLPFLDALRVVIGKIKPQESGGATAAVSDDDRAYLREKVLAIQTACTAYDKKAAKDAIVELKKKAWPQKVKDQLNVVAEHLLHSDFEGASSAAGHMDCG